jgi:hypothetical protein
MKQKILIAIGFVIISFCANAQDEKLRVAVFDPTSSGTSIDEGTKLAVQELISSAFVNTGKFSVVERSMIDKIMKEQLFQNSDIADNSQATELGKLAGANKVVLSAVSLVGGRNMLSIKIIDVQTATVDQQKTKIVGTDDLLDVVEPLTLELLGEQAVYVKKGQEFTSLETKKEEVKKEEKQVVKKDIIKNEKQTLAPTLSINLEEKQSGIRTQIEQNIDYLKAVDNSAKKNKNALLDTIITFGGNMSAAYRNGVLTISGNGTITKENSSAFKTLLSSHIKAVIIEEGITSISGFDKLSLLEYVLLPTTISTIGDDAFNNCKSLKSINISDNITKIGKSAFDNCKSIEILILPNGITQIGEEAFGRCENLTFINIPVSLTSLSKKMLIGCKSLTEIVIPDYITTIEENAFKGCSNLTSLYIPDNVVRLGEGCFSHLENLTNIRLSESITFLPKSAFDNCKNLRKITIPASVTNIGEKAFEDCNILSSVIISGENVVNIGKGCFKDDKNLHSLTVFSINPPKIDELFGGGKHEEEYYERVVVYVQDFCVSKYGGSKNWGNFLTILPYKKQ